MAAAIMDLTINEGDTFLMSIEFWEDVDNTIPIDITTDTFSGVFKFGTQLIPMVISSVSSNVIEATVNYNSMKDLTRVGKYDIDQLSGTENYRLIQGNVKVSQEVTT